MNSKKFVVVIAIIAVAAILAALYVAMSNKKIDTQSGDNKDTDRLGIVKTEVDKNKAPEKFPSNVPIESGATITQNYNATAPDGRFQATRVFETKKTLAENFTLYQNFMKNNGWKVESTVNTDKYKMILGTKDNTKLQVDMDQNSESGIKTISIYYTEVR